MSEIDITFEELRAFTTMSLGLNLGFLFSYLFYCIRELFEFLKSKK